MIPYYMAVQVVQEEITLVHPYCLVVLEAPLQVEAAEGQAGQTRSSTILMEQEEITEGAVAAAEVPTTDQALEPRVALAEAEFLLMQLRS